MNISLGEMRMSLPLILRALVVCLAIHAHLYCEIHNAVAIEIVHETTVTAAEADDSRATVGVSEAVNLWILREGVRVTDNTVSWTASVGTPATFTGATLLWEAPIRPAQSQFTATYKGATATAKIDIIQPADVKYERVSTTPPPPGGSGASMDCKVTLLPRTVSFYNVKWREDITPPANAPVEPTGKYLEYLNGPPPNPHALDHKGGAELRVTSFNVLVGLDKCFAIETPPFNQGGTFHWDIPDQYASLKGGDWEKFTTVKMFSTIVPIDVNHATVTLVKREASVTFP